MKRGTLEQSGTCEDILGVTPVEAEEEIVDEDVTELLGTELVDTEVGNTFIVSTISVKITT